MRKEKEESESNLKKRLKEEKDSNGFLLVALKEIGS